MATPVAESLLTEEREADKADYCGPLDFITLEDGLV